MKTLFRRRLPILAAAALTVSLAGAKVAHADEPTSTAASPVHATPALVPALSLAEATPAAPEPARATWYGWQTLAVDTAGLGLMTLAFSQSKSGANVGTEAAALSAGFGLYLFGGPAVHALHGRTPPAAIDFAVRLGAPVVVGLIGAGIGVAYEGQCNASGQDFCGLGPVVFGALGVVAGGIGAVVIDAAVLSHAPGAKPASSASSSGVRWSPRVAMLPRGGTTVGVAGSF
jgi:hypothetical protein